MKYILYIAGALGVALGCILGSGAETTNEQVLRYVRQAWLNANETNNYDLQSSNNYYDIDDLYYELKEAEATKEQNNYSEVELWE